MQQQGRNETIRKPLALWGPIRRKLPNTVVLPPTPRAPTPISLTFRVNRCSHSDWQSSEPSLIALRTSDDASKCVLPIPTARVAGVQPSSGIISFAHSATSSRTTARLR